MKNILILILLVFGLSTGTHAQEDIIILKNYDELVTKVIEVSDSVISYKKMRRNRPSQIVYTVPKSSVLMIKYKGKHKVYMDDSKTFKAPEAQTVATKSYDNPSVNNNTSTLSMSEQGRQDAINYYEGYKGAKAGTLLVSGLANPVLGLIPAIVCSKTPPKEERLLTPRPELLKNTTYYSAYLDEASAIKRRKTWAGYGIGSVIYVAIVSITAAIIMGAE